MIYLFTYLLVALWAYYDLAQFEPSITTDLHWSLSAVVFVFSPLINLTYRLIYYLMR